MGDGEPGGVEADGPATAAEDEHSGAGKDELVLAALAAADAEITAHLRELVDGAVGSGRGGSARVVSALGEYFAEGLERSGFRAGCPVAAVAHEAFEVDALRVATARALDRWRDLLAGVLQDEGFAAEDALDTAMTCLAAVEGALMVARVRRDRAPIDAVLRRLVVLLEEPRRSSAGATRPRSPAAPPSPE